MPSSRTSDQSSGSLDGAEPAIGLIRRWIELSELERRVFLALAHELTVSSELIEVSANGLSERFHALVTIAQAQMGRVDRIIEVARAIDVDGEAVTLGSALNAIQEGLGRAIDTIQFVSNHAIRMVETLESLERDQKVMEACTTRIEAVNQRIRALALHAADEVNRSGGAHGTLGFLNDIRDLSIDADRTAADVRTHIASTSHGLRTERDVLQEIAGTNLAQNITAQERVDGLIAALIAQQTAFHAVLTETAESSAEISAEMGETISRLVQGMQFQDRTKQHLAQVIDTLAKLGEGTIEAQKATIDAYPGMFLAGKLDDTLLAQVLDAQRLGDMKTRMLSRLMTDSHADASVSASETDDDIELF